MSAESAIVALENRYLRDYPREAARKIEGLSAEEAAQAIEMRRIFFMLRPFPGFGVKTG